jgi:hypothetical protein
VLVLVRCDEQVHHAQVVRRHHLPQDVKRVNATELSVGGGDLLERGLSRGGLLLLRVPRVPCLLRCMARWLIGVLSKMPWSIRSWLEAYVRVRAVVEGRGGGRRRAGRCKARGQCCGSAKCTCIDRA